MAEFLRENIVFIIGSISLVALAAGTSAMQSARLPIQESNTVSPAATSAMSMQEPLTERETANVIPVPTITPPAANAIAPKPASVSVPTPKTASVSAPTPAPTPKPTIRNRERGERGDDD